MELMEASVYVGDGVLEVHDVPVPEPGPGEVLIEIAQCGICGTDLHFVLERIARPGHRARSRVGGHDRRGRRRTSKGGRVGAAGGVRARARVRRVPSVRAGPAVGVPAAAPDRPPVVPRRVRPLRGGPGRPAGRGARRTCRRAPPRSPSRPRSRSHAVTLSGVTPADRVLVTGARTGRAARDRGAARAGHRRRHRVRAGAGPPRARARRSARRGSSRRTRCRRPRMGSPVPEPYTVVFECSGNAAGGRVGHRPARLRRRVRAGGDRPRLPPPQPQPGDRAREHDHRLLQLRRRRLRAGARRCWRRGAMPLDALVEPVDVFLDELLPVMQRCAAGELPGKVMVRPRRSEGAVMSRRRAIRPTAEPRGDDHGARVARRRRSRRDQGLLRRRLRLDRG